MVGATLAMKTDPVLSSGAAAMAAGSMSAMTSDKGGGDGDDDDDDDDEEEEEEQDTNLVEDTVKRRTACRSLMVWPAAARWNDFNLCDMLAGRSGPKAEAEPNGAHPTTRRRNPTATVFMGINVSKRDG